MPQKPIESLTKLERLREVVALQRLRAAGGMEGSHRTDLTFLRNPSVTGPLLYSFRGHSDPWDTMIDYYFKQADEEYEKLKHNWNGEGQAFQQLLREKGLKNVVTYRIETRKAR